MVPQVLINGIRVRLTWRCLWSSSIFRSSMVSSISAGDRLRWTPSLPRAGWKNHYSRGKKASIHEGRNLAGVGWESLDGYSVLLGGQSVGRVFFRENIILIVGATSGPLSEEVISESVDSEVASLSSPHAWRYAYHVSHCRIFLYYQWSR